MMLRKSLSWLRSNWTKNESIWICFRKNLKTSSPLIQTISLNGLPWASKIFSTMPSSRQVYEGEPFWHLFQKNARLHENLKRTEAEYRSLDLMRQPGSWHFRGIAIYLLSQLEQDSVSYSTFHLSRIRPATSQTIPLTDCVLFAYYIFAWSRRSSF